MKASAFFLALTVLFFFASCSGSGNDAETDSDTMPIIVKKEGLPSKAGIVQPKLIVRSQRTPYEDAVALIGDSLFYCTYKGKIESSDTIKREKHLVFDIKAEFMVDRIFISYLGSSRYFINWQETDHNGVRTYVAVVERGNPKPIWKKQYLVPNPGQAAIDQGTVYISALGTVARLNLEDGSEIWKLDSLYNTATLSYQKFQPVVVQENRVIYIDYAIPGKRNQCDTLKLDPATGRNLK